MIARAEAVLPGASVLEGQPNERFQNPNIALIALFKMIIKCHARAYAPSPAEKSLRENKLFALGRCALFWTICTLRLHPPELTQSSLANNTGP